MGLDVYVLRPPFGADPTSADQRICRIEYDGYFRYLMKFLPESSSTGRRIQDVIHAGDAWFEGANLDQLRGCLNRALASLDGQPSRWSEHVGAVWTRADPTLRKKLDSVERETLRARISTLLRAIEDAQEFGGRVLFYGE